MIIYQGKGLVNRMISALPIEVHIPTYSYCGPGTKLDKRLERGDKPINKLDSACMAHDIHYRNNKDLKRRHEADAVLAEEAWKRFKAQDASLGEKTAALLVSGTMKAKRKLGMGKRVIQAPKFGVPKNS